MRKKTEKSNLERTERSLRGGRYYRQPKTGSQRRAVSASVVDIADEPDTTPAFRASQHDVPDPWDDIPPDRSKFQWVRAMKRMLKRGDSLAVVARRLHQKWGIPRALAQKEVAFTAQNLEREGLIRRNPGAPAEVSVRRVGPQFAVIVNGADTGKYAYSRAKALEIGRKLVGMRRNPNETFFGENDIRALAEEIRRDSLRGDAPFGWSEAGARQIAELFDPAPDKRAQALREAAAYLERIAFSSPHPMMYRERARDLRAEAHRLSSL